MTNQMPATYQLDPDFRRDAPETGAHCANCQRAIKDPTKAIRVTVDWSTFRATLGGPDLIGADCWAEIARNNRGLYGK